MQVLARAPKVRFRAEVRHIDYQRIAFPMAARIAKPLADARRQMRASVHDDVSLPTLPLTHVVEHRDATRRLHDSAEAPTVGCSKFGQPAGQATVRQSSVLRPIVP